MKKPNKNGQTEITGDSNNKALIAAMYIHLLSKWPFGLILGMLIAW